MGILRDAGIVKGPSPFSNANRGKDASPGDYKKGNTRDKSKTHTKSNPGRSGGKGNNGGRR